MLQLTDRANAVISFGFDEAKATRALKKTKNSGLEAALEWLEKHQDDPVEPSDDEDEEEAKLADQGEAKVNNAHHAEHPTRKLTLGDCRA